MSVVHSFKCIANGGRTITDSVTATWNGSFVSEEVYGYGSLGVLEGERQAPLGADIDTDEVLSSGVLESWGPLGAGMDTFDEDLSSGVLAALSPSVV